MLSDIDPNELKQFSEKMMTTALGYFQLNIHIHSHSVSGCIPVLNQKSLKKRQ